MGISDPAAPLWYTASGVPCSVAGGEYVSIVEGDPRARLSRPGARCRVGASVHRRHRPRRLGRRAARRHRRSVEPRPHRAHALGRHQRRRSVLDSGPAAGHLFGDVHAAGVQHGQARRHRADRHVHRHGQRRPAGRRRGRRPSPSAAKRRSSTSPARAPSRPSTARRCATIPTSRLYSSLTQLVPALNVQGNDVGGSQGNVFSVFQIHGGRRNEGQVLVDGMSGGYQGMGVSGYAPEVGNAQEDRLLAQRRPRRSDHRRAAVEHHRQVRAATRFAGSFFINGSGAPSSTTTSAPEQRAKGLSTPLKPKKLCDINPSFGGPIKRDRLWFFATYRYQLQPADGRQHVGQPERGRQQQVDLRPGLHQAGRGRRRLEEPLRPPDVAGDAAQQDRRLDRPALQLPALRCRRVELRASPSPAWSPRGRRCSATRTIPAA